MSTSTEDKMSGLVNEAIGSAKQSLGKMTGSEKLQAEGIAQEAKGEAQKAAGETKAAIKDGANKVADTINKAI